jgi:lysozyme
MSAEAVGIAASLCRQFEGLYLKPYLCPALVPTIGYGATRYEDGRKVTLADPAITPARAEELLRWELNKVCIPAVKRSCPALQEPRKLAALLDFTFNLGSGNLHSSTLRKKINAEDWDAAQLELAKWVRGGGRILPGLVKRRTAEAALLRSICP